MLFGATRAVFEAVSPQKLIAIVPHRVSTSIVTVITPQGRGSSPLAFVVSNDPRIPDEVSYKAGYVNPEPPPANFGSARLWGIAIADTRVPGHESAQVEVAWTRLSCRVDGREVVLNDDGGQVRGGLYRRQPWFGTDAHDPMPLDRSRSATSHVGGAPRGTACGSGLAFLEPVSAGGAAGGQARRLHGSGPGQDFCRRLAANGHGLLAFSDCPVRIRREQSRSRRQQLVFSFSTVAGSHVHRCWRTAVLTGTRFMEAGRPRPAGRAGRPSSITASLLE